MSNNYAVELRDIRTKVTADRFCFEDGNFNFYTAGELVASFNNVAVQYVARQRPEELPADGKVSGGYFERVIAGDIPGRTVEMTTGSARTRVIGYDKAKDMYLLGTSELVEDA